MDGALSRSALIRYDAYEDTGGHQSASMAILDSARSGIVLTAIQGRDYARVYVKQLDRGRTPIALSPEEQQAVERAMARRSSLDRSRSATLRGALGQVLVLNASYEPLNVCSVRRAHVLVFKGKAEVLEEHEMPLHSATDTFARPHVIRLVQYVRVPRAAQRKISRRALFARDEWSCVYCGTSGGRLTLDHVVPRSRGGDSVWENVVTACAPCNLRKGDRLPEEASMTMRAPAAPACAGALHPLAAPSGCRPPGSATSRARRSASATRRLRSPSDTASRRCDTSRPAV